MYRTLKDVRRKAAISNAVAVTLATCAFVGVILTIGFIGNSILGAALSSFGTLGCALIAGVADANRYWYEREEKAILVDVTNKYHRKEDRR